MPAISAHMIVRGDADCHEARWRAARPARRPVRRRAPDASGGARAGRRAPPDRGPAGSPPRRTSRCPSSDAFRDASRQNYPKVADLTPVAISSRTKVPAQSSGRSRTAGSCACAPGGAARRSRVAGDRRAIVPTTIGASHVVREAVADRLVARCRRSPRRPPGSATGTRPARRCRGRSRGSSAAVIVILEREVPGASARTWARPIFEAVADPDLVEVTRLGQADRPSSSRAPKTISWIPIIHGSPR